MKSNRDDTINELAAELEDLTVTVEELQIAPPANVEQKSLKSVKEALDQASAATAELESQQDNATIAPDPKE